MFKLLTVYRLPRSAYWFIGVILGILCVYSLWTWLLATTLPLLIFTIKNNNWSSFSISLALGCLSFCTTLYQVKTYKNKSASIENIKYIYGYCTHREKQENLFSYTLYAKEPLTKKTYKISAQSKHKIPLMKKASFYLLIYPTANNENIIKSSMKNGIHGYGYIKNYTMYNDSNFIYNVISLALENFVQLKEKIQITIKEKLSNKTNSLFNMILCGLKDRNIDIKNTAQTWGVSHYFARSGLHIMIILSIVISLLALFHISYTTSLFLSLIFILLFAALTTSSISFLRALIYIILYIITQLLRVQTSPLHLFFMLSTGFLICNPLLLFSLDFQLSFGITGLLLYIFSVNNLK